jgi:molybdopterin synthase catalytic subunit/molybdopterin converting factor small subunit
MRVRVLFFGVLREAFAAREQWFEVPGDSCTVATLLAAVQAEAPAQVRPLWASLAVALNRDDAHSGDTIHTQDEVALLPPVSGGTETGTDTGADTDADTPPHPRVVLTDQPLDAQASVAALKAGQDGAVVVFDGIVRDNTRGRATRYLVYEAYAEMATRQMHTLLTEVRSRFAARDALLHHRLGRLEVGETSVLIAVASAHRGAAFDACRWLIDTLKTTVPIWKKEFFVDGAVWTDGEPFPEPLRPRAGSSELPG